MIRIMDDTMTLVIGKCAVPTARFSEHAAADGDGVWSFPLTRPGCSPRPGDRGVDARRAPRRRLRRRRPLCEGVARGTVPVADRLIRILTAITED